MSRPNSWYQAFFATVLFALAYPTLFAQNDSSRYDPFLETAVLHIGYVNTDCVQDTVYGLLDQKLRWTPRFICWGVLYDSAGLPVCDVSRRDSSIARSRQVDTTYFVFPNWRNLSCAFSIERHNANDTLDDLVFWLRGVDSLPRRGLVDTGAAVLVFGQSALETHATLDLSGVGDFRSQPFYAMQLGKSRELINPKKRESLSRGKSWELVRVDKDVLKKEREDTTESPAPQFVSSVETEAGYTARVFPNPAFYTTSVEVKPLPAGTYTVTVIAVNGEEVYRAEETLLSEGEVFQTIDLARLASGHYVLRITTPDRLIGSYPVIVVR